MPSTQLGYTFNSATSFDLKESSSDLLPVQISFEQLNRQHI